MESAIPIDAIFTVRSAKWRKETKAGAEASEYIAMCRRMGEFSVANLQKLMITGTSLVLAVGGLVNSARLIQLIRFRELRYAREFVERAQHLYPEIASEIMSIDLYRWSSS